MKRKLREDAFILRTNTGDVWQVEDGHTLEEYRQAYGGMYDEGELWDFSEEDVKAGAIEAQPNMVYWRIVIDGEPRYFETTKFDEWSIDECREELGECKEPLEEGTSNFRTPDNFPLLVFYTYDEFYGQIEASPDYPDLDDFEDEDGDTDYEAWEEAKDAFEEKCWNENKVCTLDEDEVERLENKLYEFNEETKRIAEDADVGEDGYQQYGDKLNLEDVELKIEPGYYEAAYIDVDNESSLEYIEDGEWKETQIKRIKDFMYELKKEFGLSEYEVAWGPASNGETGYRQVETKNEAIKESEEELSKSDCIKKELIARGLDKEEDIDGKEVIDIANKCGCEQSEVVDVWKYGKSLKEGGPGSGDHRTSAQRYNDRMHKIFDGAKQLSLAQKQFLINHGVSEEEAEKLYQDTGLHGSALQQKLIDMGLKDEFFSKYNFKTNKLEESPENPSTHLGYKEDGEEVIKQVGHSYLLKKGNRYIVRYAPGYYVHDIKASSDKEAIEKFLGLREDLEMLGERKSKKKLNFRFTGDPAKDAVFFNHCQGTDVGGASVEASSVSLGESQEDYYVVSDGKNPKHSYVFTEKGRESAIDMLKDYKGNGYWEVLHYVKGTPKMIYNTRDGYIEEK